MRILIFGGSFNPVHWGHLVLAEELREEFGWDRVLFVPASRSPFKGGRDDPGGDHRLAMLELACAGNSGFIVDTRELKRGGDSWTIDTVRSVIREYELADRPGLVLGDDLVRDFSEWKESAALMNEARIIVARRSTEMGCQTSFGEPASNRLIPISSSEIRERLATGRSVRYLIPERVHDYILQKGLYGSRGAG